MPSPATRRTFMKSTAAAALAAGLTGPSAAAETTTKRLKLGFDNFSIRALGWKADQLLDYAAEQKVDALLISDLDAYDSLDAAHLKEIGDKARGLGIELHCGTLSLCPSSVRFDNKRGTAQEHAKLLVRVARDLGVKTARCVVGFAEDRKTPGGIFARMKDLAGVLRETRNFALDCGVKFAVENHAGDMQSWELVQLIEDCGADFVGATVDTGNATWTLEDPLGCMETLAAHTLTSGIRDSMIWKDEHGAVVQWTAVGEGCVDFKTIARRWSELTPEVPFILEIISGFSRPFPYDKAEFWEPYREVRAAEFRRFQKLADLGKPIPPFKADGPDRKKAEQDYQKAELERSLTYCRETLSMGRKAT
ncbi:MAG: sugar phosphate isomerase/epimerase [Verrucomicrobiales bacterium]|nr:sugar phosphate isomerase/epimerase [Verrucomicrobiales bacterium]